MGLTWALGWALAGLIVGVASKLLPWFPLDPLFRVFDAPLPAAAIPGFAGGAIFSVVLGIASRRRRFSELSLPWFTIWGALGGVLLSLVPAVMVGVGLAHLGDDVPGLWRMTAVIAGPLVVLSGLSAAGTLVLARRASGPSAQAGNQGAGELTGGEARASLEAGDGPLFADDR
jgi:hypothetical protein